MDKVEDKTEVIRNGLDFDEPHPKFRGINDSKISESDLALWEQSPPFAEISSENAQSRTGKNSKLRLSRLGSCLSVTTVVLTLVCVWVLFAIPHLCYFHLGLCTEQSSAEEEVGQVQLIQNCSARTYTGTQCINNFASCSNPLVNTAVNSSMESDLQTLFFLLDTQTLSSNCESEKQSIKEFVCLYSYQPCDIDNNGILPTRSKCEYLKDTACPNEWSLLQNGQYGSLLPKCGELPDESSNKNCSSNGTTVTPPTDNSDTMIPNTNTTDGQATCNNVMYLGDSCTEYLNPCLVDNYVSSSEASLSFLFTLFTQAKNQSCKDAQSIVEEFLCQAIFPRCDSNYTTHYPNRSICEHIRDDLCPEDWVTIKMLAGGLLPECSNLPNTSIEPMCIDATPTQPVAVPTTTATVSPTVSPQPVSISLQCNEAEGFYLYITDEGENVTINNSCQARCSEWNQFGNQAISILDDVMILFFTSIGVIAGIAVVVLSFIRRERMFVFPSVFLVYGVLHVTFLGIIVLIQYTDRKALFCSSNDLVITSTENPTVYCQLSGFIFLHAIVGITYWWFAHILAIFWKIMFPFHARIHQDKEKYIHIVAVILGIIIPFVTPSFAFAFKGYSVNRYPPLLCLPTDPDVIYYGIVIPLSLTITIGMSQLIFVLHVVHKKSRLFHYRVSKTHAFGMSTAEKKLLLVFVYYVLVGYVDIIGFTVTTSSLDVLLQYTQEHLLCEALRVDPDYVCPKRFEEVRVSLALSLVAYVILGFYPIINLVFAINKSEIRVKFVNTFPSLFTESFRTSTLGSAMNAPDTPFTMKRRLTYNMSSVDDHIKRTHEMATIGKSGIYLKRDTSVSV